MFQEAYYNRAFDYTKNMVSHQLVGFKIPLTGLDLVLPLIWTLSLNRLSFQFLLVHSKTEQKDIEVTHICPLPLTLAQPSSISASPPVGTFVTADQPILMGHNHSKSIVYMRVHSWFVSTIIMPHRILKSSVLFIFPSLLTPGILIFYCLHAFVFSKYHIVRVMQYVSSSN